VRSRCRERALEFDVKTIADEWIKSLVKRTVSLAGGK
jgi:hypothetical protein